MREFLWGVGILAFITALGFARAGLLGYWAKPLQNASETISFPFTVTLSVARGEIPVLNHTGVYDGVAVRRNPMSLEMRLVNTTDPNTVDPFSFFLPLEQGALRQMASLLTAEADRLDEKGSPYWR